jgi:hypothetical protein
MVWKLKRSDCLRLCFFVDLKPPMWREVFLGIGKLLADGIWNPVGIGLSFVVSLDGTLIIYGPMTFRNGESFGGEFFLVQF